MLQLVADRFTPPALDTAVSSAILEAVAGGADPVLRVWVPDRAVAFGRQDRVRPGYRQAVGAVSDQGYAPVERLAGGKAAVFHEHTIAFSWAMPAADPRASIEPRFRMIAGIVAAALGSLGADARIGEVPGEYCPGSWSVNLGGARKVMGVGQRLIRGAAHLGGVLVVDGADLVNRPLAAAYAALGYSWRPEATGAIAESVPGITTAEVAETLIAAATADTPTTPGSVDAAVLSRAEALAPDHDATR